MNKVYSRISPHFRKLQIWDEESLLRNTPLSPPFWKTSDLGWTKFTPEYPPPPHFGKLQISDEQSLLRNTPLPPILENFRFGMNKVYSGIPPSPREFKNAESYFMWRLYPTRITTRYSRLSPVRLINHNQTLNFQIIIDNKHPRNTTAKAALNTFMTRPTFYLFSSQKAWRVTYLCHNKKQRGCAWNNSVHMLHWRTVQVFLLKKIQTNVYDYTKIKTRLILSF